MKSGWHHAFVIVMYLLVMAGGWYFYDTYGRAMLERMEYRSENPGGDITPGKPRPMSQMFAQTQDSMQDTIRVTTIKIFIVIVFAALAIAMLGHIALASSSGSLKKVEKFIGAVRNAKDPAKYRLGKSEKYYPLFAQVSALADELAKQRESAAQASGLLSEGAGELERAGNTQAAAKLRDGAAKLNNSTGKK